MPDVRSFYNYFLGCRRMGVLRPFFDIPPGGSTEELGNAYLVGRAGPHFILYLKNTKTTTLPSTGATSPTSPTKTTSKRYRS